MSINNQIEALSIRNTATKAVNMTEFNNPFLLLSSTKALNELVVNTNPSSRAKVANIEPTKDTATGAKVSRKKLKADAISKLSKQTASSAISAALSNVGKKAKAKPKPSPVPVIAFPTLPPKRGPGRPKLDKKPSEATVVKRAVGRPKNPNPKPDKPKRPVGRPKSDKKPSEGDKPKRPVGRPKKSTVVAPKQRAGGGSYETGGLGGF